jgi:hypothetical protein
VHLLLGDAQDAFCSRVRSMLEARHFATRVVANPLAHPALFAWRLDNAQSTSRLAWDDEPPIAGDDIAGVLVAGTAWIDPAGWQRDDLAYVHAETQAALLAWLWSLRCPVVNRFPAAIWCRPRIPLLFWHRLLRRCGLPTPATLVTNVDREARAFAALPGEENLAAVVYGPITSDARYLVTSDQDWDGVAAMQRYAPICLTHPHGAAQLACVVGDRVVWEGEPPPEMIRLEPALRRFAAASGLAFVELAFAAAADGRMGVVAVEPHPNFERFGDMAREWIVEEIVGLMTDTPHTLERPVHSGQPSLA